ncbi:YkvA family protein [Prevotella aurantiaca]
MKIPDLSKYKEKFTKNDFIEKIQRIAKRAGAKLVYAALILYYSIDSDKVSFKEKAIIIGALGYLITPLDIMPDAIPLVGLSDDLGVLIYVLRKVLDYVDDEAKQKAKDKLSQWFDKDEMKATENLFVDRIEDEPV